VFGRDEDDGVSVTNVDYPTQNLCFRLALANGSRRANSSSFVGNIGMRPIRCRRCP